MSGPIHPFTAATFETADDLGGSSTAFQGCGRLNVYNAMAVALSDPTLPTPVP